MKGNENSQDMCPRCMTPLRGQKLCPKCKFDPSTYTPAKHHLPPRTILDGKYLVGCVLGEGGFGITYVGWDLQLHTMVAIKEYFPTGIVFRDNTQSNVVSVFSGSGEEYYLHDREKFLEEARMLAKFDGNPGIVNVKNYFKENGTAYIVMEYVQGINLAVLMEQNNDKLPFDRVLKLLELPIRTLSEMHRQNTFHRDISPENLMVTNDNLVKLIDFGSTKTNKKDKSRFLKVRPGYSPLELYTAGGKEGPYSDIYSLSATIYKAITGITPPAATDRIQDDKLIPPIKAGAKGITPGQEKALLKGMAVKAQDRFQSVEDLYAALYTRRSAKPKPAEVSGGRQAKPSGPNRNVIIAIVAALAVLAGILIWNATKPKPLPVPEPTPTPVVTEAPTEEPTEAPTEAPTEEPTEAPTEEHTEAPTEVPAENAAAFELTEEMFADAPEAWAAYRDGTNYPYGVSAFITPDGVRIVSDDDYHPTDPDKDGYENGDDPSVRGPISGNELNAIARALTGAEMPLDNICLLNLNIGAVDPFVDGVHEDAHFHLSFANCDFENIKQVGALGERLSSLSLCGYLGKVTDLDFLQSCPNLQGLTLISLMNGEPMAWNGDLSGLAKLQSLEALHLDWMGLTEVPAEVATLPNLVDLGFNGDSIRDLSPISGMEQLEYLCISSNGLEDISPLSGLTGLINLSMVSNEIYDLAPLAGLENLATVDLGGNCISDFSPIEREGLTIYGRDDQHPRADDMTGGYSAVEPYELTDAMFAEVPAFLSAWRNGLEIPYAVRCVISPSGIRFLKVDEEYYCDPDASASTDITGEQLASAINAIYGMNVPVTEIVLDGWRFETLSPLARPWKNLVFLRINQSALPEDFPVVAAMGESLEHLEVWGSIPGCDDLAWLTEFTNLDVLTLVAEGKSEESPDLESIGRLSQLHQLYLLNWHMEDIAPLSNLTELEALSLHFNDLTDLSPLSGMTGLTWLQLSMNEIEDLSPLAGMTKLEHLEIDDNHVSDLSPLAGLENLEEVHLAYNLISDFSPVEHVSRVIGRYRQGSADTDHTNGYSEVEPYELTADMFGDLTAAWNAYANGMNCPYTLNVIVSPNGIRFVKEEDGFDFVDWHSERKKINGKNLASVVNALHSSGLPISEIVFQCWHFQTFEPFARPWPDAVKLTFDVCTFPEDLNRLADMGDSLTSLRLIGGFDGADLSWLANLSELYMLDLNAIDAGNEGTLLENVDLNFLPSLQKLEGLNINFIHITDLSPIVALTSMRSMNLDNCGIGDLSQLSEMTWLYDLYIGGNGFGDLSPLSNLTNLRNLAVAYNGIRDISPLTWLMDLEYLNIGYNEISDLTPLQGLENLRHVDLEFNYITDFTPVDKVPQVFGRYHQNKADAFEMDDDVFNAVPEALEAWRNGEPWPYEVDLVISAPEGMHFYRNGYQEYVETKADDLPHGDISRQYLNNILDAIQFSGAPVNNIHLCDANLESLAPLVRDWGRDVRLDLRECALPEDWLEVTNLGERLTALSLNECDPYGLDGLERLLNCPNLTDLELSIDFESGAEQGLAPDLNVIGQMTQLTFLELNCWDIGDISPLANLVNLNWLTLDSSRQLTDISPLASLVNLTYLRLTSCPVSDISPLAGLDKLGYVKLSGCPIEDYSPVDHVAEVVR